MDAVARVTRLDVRRVLSVEVTLAFAAHLNEAQPRV